MRTPSLFWLLACWSLISPPCVHATDFRDVLASLQKLEARDDDPHLDLPPPRPPSLARKFQPWGDGFVRMPVQRHVFNGTRRYRTGRMRMPKKPTYPASSTNTSAPSNSSDLIARDTGIEPATPPAAPPGSPQPGMPGPGWSWSHLDDYEGMAYMIERG